MYFIIFSLAILIFLYEVLICSYDANLTTVITWKSNYVFYNLFTCDVSFPVWGPYLECRCDAINDKNFHEILMNLLQILATSLCIRLKLLFSDEKLYASLGSFFFVETPVKFRNFQILKFIKVGKSDGKRTFLIPFKVFVCIFEM